MAKTVKVLSIILMAAILVSTLGSVVLADPASDIQGLTGNNSAPNAEVTRIAQFIVNLVRYIGTAVAVIIIIVLGIKYMTASAEGKADLKSSMLPYIIGAFLVFAGAWIVSAIASASMGLTGGNTTNS